MAARNRGILVVGQQMPAAQHGAVGQDVRLTEVDIAPNHTDAAESVRRWWDYTLAYRRMIEATHMSWAPWHIVPADNKRRARLNLIRHLLDSIPYRKVDIELPKIPKAQPRPKNAAVGRVAGLLECGS